MCIRDRSPYGKDIEIGEQIDHLAIIDKQRDELGREHDRLCKLIDGAKGDVEAMQNVLHDTELSNSELRAKVMNVSSDKEGSKNAWKETDALLEKLREQNGVLARLRDREEELKRAIDDLKTNLTVAVEEHNALSQEVDDAELEAYKLPSEAFGDDSAGTQSDIDLYCVREGDWPHAAKFENRDLVEAKAGPENFTPSADVPGRLCTALQFAGDVVIVPPKSWHQTYALEPSCAVASQFCGRRDAPTVFEHMLRHRSRLDDGVLDLARTAPPRDAVRALFARLDSDS